MVMFHKIGQLDYLWDVIVNSHFSIRIFKIAGLYQALKHKNHISANDLLDNYDFITENISYDFYQTFFSIKHSF